MALKNKMPLTLLFILGSFATVAQVPVAKPKPKPAPIRMPELLTKQAVNNIRFLSQDGKFTYYQKRSGSLLYSSNYTVKEILTGKLGTQYTVIGTPARKKVAVMQNENFHNFYSQRAVERIYLLDFGKTTPKEIGTGSAAQLHLDDTWLSYYDFYTKVLTFENTSNSALKFTIKLNNKINPYFTPQAVMSDENTVYYTDLGENGAVGLLQYKRTENKAEIIYKAPSPMLKAELCIHQQKLIVGLFGINSYTAGSEVSSVDLPLTDFTKRSPLYKSTLNDIGRLVCSYDNAHIAFIKNFGTNSIQSNDIVEINATKKFMAKLSDTGSISNIINMDGTLLTLDKNKYFIVKGMNDYKNIDSLKSLPPSSADPATKKMDENL